MIDSFAPALAGADCWLELAGGERRGLPAASWCQEPSAADEVLLSRCAGPTLDVGCGPGRLAAALTSRGVVSLGIDSSPVAVALTARRGGVAMQRDVFRLVPGEGRWRHVLLADGNIGIGGDPEALLYRMRELLAPAGSALVESGSPGGGLRREMARVRVHNRPAERHPWFPWAWIGLDALAAVAARVGLALSWSAAHEGRWFTELRTC